MPSIKSIIRLEKQLEEMKRNSNQKITALIEQVNHLQKLVENITSPVSVPTGMKTNRTKVPVPPRPDIMVEAGIGKD